MTGSPDPHAAHDFLVGRAKSGSPDAAPTPVRTLGHNAPPKVGDEVEVVLRGKVERIWRSGGIEIGDNVIHDGRRHVVSVEVLTPPAPTWEAGDVVTWDLLGVPRLGVYVADPDADGDHWLDPKDPETRWFDTQIAAQAAKGTLTILVRAGKAVTP